MIRVSDKPGADLESALKKEWLETNRLGRARHPLWLA